MKRDKKIHYSIKTIGGKDMKTITDVLGNEYNLSDFSYFVTMSDTFLSGWGNAERKTAKRVVLCKTWREAQIIMDGISNCRNNNGMRYVNVCNKFPKYNRNKYTVSVDLFDNCTLYIEKSNIKL